MPRSLARPLALLATAFVAVPCFAKSPEDFVGPPPAQTQPAPPAQGQTPPAKAAPKPAAGGPTASGAQAMAPAPAARPAAAPARTAAKPAAAKPSLDTARIHAIYLDGDFDQAIRTCEGALRGKKPLTHTDSVFIFKHLGVMFAATPATREKGRYYMLQLISIEPTAKILDMYASDMIYLIFRNVQEEFETKHGKTAVVPAPEADTTPAPAPVAPAPAPAPVAQASNGRNKTLYWVAGGTAVAAGTAALLFILLDNPQPKKHNIVLNE